MVARKGEDKSGGVAINGQHDPCTPSDKNVLHLDSINVKTLVVILHYSSARCHH